MVKDPFVHGKHLQKDRVSICCIIISLVFFLVLSQFLILKTESITPLFRPLIIICAFFIFLQRGLLPSSVSIIAFIAANYELIVMLIELNNVAGISDIIRGGVTVSLYLLMCASACAVPWNGQEILMIIKFVFLGCFICAVVFFVSNDMSNIHYTEIKMLGVTVNRNKNAYTFSLGTLIGLFNIIQSRTLFRKLSYIFMTSLMVYCVLYSQCRGAFICLVLGIIILMIGKALQIKKVQGDVYLLYILLFLVGCVIVYYLLKHSDLSRLVDGESTSGRDEGIEVAWKMFLESDFFHKILGNGFTYESRHSNIIGAHLVFVTFLVSSGIIGATLISFIFLSGFKRMRNVFSLSLLGFAFTRTLFEGLDYYIYIPLILSVILHNYQIYYRRPVYGVFQ